MKQYYSTFKIKLNLARRHFILNIEPKWQLARRDEPVWKLKQSPE